MKADSLTWERTNELLHYNAASGEITWRVTRCARARRGQIAGTIEKEGYRQICIDGVNCKAHRLAWFLVHRKWPNGDIDHINGDRTDNRIENLRDVTRQGNQHNRRRAQINNRSGWLGVSKVKSGRYAAQIQVNSKLIHLGTFDTPEAAHQRYLDAKRELHSTCSI